VRYFARFENGKLVPGSMVEDAHALASQDVPISEMGRIVLLVDDEGFVQDWARACGVCWKPTEGDNLECAEHATTYGPAQKTHPIDVSVKDLWERGEI
jgi:hypothetical protein